MVQVVLERVIERALEEDACLLQTVPRGEEERLARESLREDLYVILNGIDEEASGRPSASACSCASSR